MTIPTEHWDSVASLPSFTASVIELAKRSVAGSFPAIARSDDYRIDWRKALLVASLVRPDATQVAFDGAVRIGQGCLQDPSAGEDLKDAAAVIMESLGNHRAVSLAVSKSFLTPPAPDDWSLPVQLDTIRRSLELSIPLQSGAVIDANDFQRKFWDAASAHRWVSVSAPTSAGKSFVVKKWLEERFSEAATYTAAYIVPTRALIEEVTTELRMDLNGLAEVFNLPWDPRSRTATKRVFVVTQERMHLVLQLMPELTVNLLFIDEAQKLGDSSRGVLLQRVIDDAIASSPDAQVLFASPTTSNPEILLEHARVSASAVASGMVTVNQNLIYADQISRKPLRWTSSVVVDGSVHPVGEFSLNARATTLRKRLAYVAVALGSKSRGNLVYANGAAEAEAIGELLYDSLGPDSDVADQPAIDELQDLVGKTIHPQYALKKLLRRGIAFHYGNMPLLVREQIEALFRAGAIQYLVCTSTLLEGVNLPCQNLFVRAPRKGNSNPMSVADFWNLAGRAGRWGIEFQGNIVCIDTTVPGAWANIPRSKTPKPIQRSTDQIAVQYEDLTSFIRHLSPRERAITNPLLEALTSMLASKVDRGEKIADLGWLPIDQGQAVLLEELIVRSLAGVTVSSVIRARHAGISPHSMQRLSEFFASQQLPDGFELSPPEDQDAWHAYKQALQLVDQFLGGHIGDNPRRQTQLAILLVGWMRGKSLARLIEDRVRFERSKDGFSLPPTIRSVMNDVEQFARFEAPLYLTCYQDLLIERFPQLAHDRPENQSIIDIAMMLELGVSRVTELSMMAIGLSRTSSVTLGEYVTADSLTPDQVVAWIAQNDIEALDIPAIIQREVISAHDRYRLLDNPAVDIPSPD